MTDPLQAVLFPPRTPGWILRGLINDWEHDFVYGYHTYDRGHFRENEIKKQCRTEGEMTHDEVKIELAAELIADANERDHRAIARAILAPHLAKIKELEAENTASMREIALERERADKAEAKVAALRKRLVVDDAMMGRAWSVFVVKSTDRPPPSGEAILAALTAALGKDDYNG